MLAPSTNGCTFVINDDKSVPICGNWDVIPPIIPPTIPPINLPIAVPMPSSSSPPSFISQLSPGICASAPIAARTNAISAITAPTPKTPIIAPGTNDATALRAIIIADNKPIPTIPFSRTFVSIPLRASAIPEKNAIRTSTAA